MIYASPILFGIEAPIGLLIVAFALWEAWKFNRRHPIIFNGPFRVGEAGPSAPFGAAYHA
jgi:hypothetical protein